MKTAMVRKTAVAGTWYSADPDDLARDVDGYLAGAPRVRFRTDAIHALIVPHAGLMFSGPTAAAAYAAVAGNTYDALIVVGPSHYVGFDGVAAWPAGAFASPLGDLRVQEDDVERLVSASRIVSTRLDAHLREHSLEMQLPFLARLFPETPIVPLVMGLQVRRTVDQLADALAGVFANRRVLLIASSDLSHFFDARTADTLDRRVAHLVDTFDAQGLMQELEQYPEYERGRCVMCGGGPAVAVMSTAQRLGAREGAVISRSHSGVVSGDNDQVVGYLAGAFGALKTQEASR
jgi:AmmeMemoRadiSam system protein B